MLLPSSLPSIVSYTAEVTKISSVSSSKNPHQRWKILPKRLYQRRKTPHQRLTPKKGESTPKKLGTIAQSILDVLSDDPYLKREEIAERVGLKLEGPYQEIVSVSSLLTLMVTRWRAASITWQTSLNNPAGKLMLISFWLIGSHNSSIQR